MARSSSRSSDWGFPRWRGYGAEREAVQVRLCDRHGCDQPGDCPAPKAPNTTRPTSAAYRGVRARIA